MNSKDWSITQPYSLRMGKTTDHLNVDLRARRSEAKDPINHDFQNLVKLFGT